MASRTCGAVSVLSLLPHTPNTPPPSVSSSLQLLTDRFAKESDDGSPCGDLTNYCGGTFKGIVNKLDYIQNLGANAIWISPIPLQTDGGYHGYWQQNIFQVNPNFGSSDDLKELVSECHKRDIWVMLDM